MRSRGEAEAEKPKGDSLKRAMEVWQRNKSSREYAMDAFSILELAGSVPRQKYLEMFLEMDEKYPGRGWRIEMDQLERFYHDCGLSLKDYPEVQDVGIVKAITGEK